MAPEVVYYLFSVSTVFLFVLHLWNTIFLKLTGRNLIGKTFKKGTSEYKSIEKFISRRFVNVIIVALILSSINLAFAIREVFLAYNGQDAVTVLIIFTSMALVIIVGTVMALREYLGDNAGKRPVRHIDDEDD